MAKSGANAYVPPSKRAITNQPTVSGAPFDPAIISSQLAKPGTGNGSQARTDDKTKTQSGEAGSSDFKASVAKALASGGTTSDKTKPSSPMPADESASKAAVDGSNIMRNVTDAFKQFNQSEKLRIQAAQRQQQQQRATNARQEKSVKLNDLKKFSQNFKLNSRVPEDLVPILAKSKEKQDEIIKRADQSVREQQEQRTTTVPPAAQKSAKTDSEQPTPRTATPNESSGEAMTAPQIGSRTRSQQQAGKVPPASNQPPRVASQANQRAQMPVRGTSAAGGPSPVSIPPFGATGPQVDSAVLSPTSASAMRFNAKAMEFKPNPAASTFTPTGSAGPEGARSKRPSVISPPPPGSGRPSPPTEFFPPSHKKSKLADIPAESATAACFSPVARLLEQSQNDETKKSQYASNGGIPQCYRTAPVWESPEENSEKSFVDFFPKTVQPSAGPQHLPQNGALPHQHQLPLHLQNGGPHNHQQSHFYRGQPHSGSHHMDDQRMHFSSAASSVQPSPRLAQQTMVFNGQAPQMPGYPYGMPPAGMSPAMAMRTLPGGAQFTPGSPMGGHMMVQQPSNGPYGHLGQQQMQMYPSPVPTHVQPHFGGHAGQPMVGGYAGSPRANPMSHQGSQQGHVPQQMFMMPNQMMMMPHHAGPSKYC